MMVVEKWIRLYACRFSGVSIAQQGQWPESIIKLVARYREEPNSDTLLIPGTDVTAIEAAVKAFENSNGFSPEREEIPRYSAGNEEQYSFYFLGVGSRELRLKLEVNYDRQKECGNQVPEPLANAGMGCTNGKNQTTNFTLERPLSSSLPDIFRLTGGPRLPVSRVFGVSERLRDALLGAQATGCEIRDISSAGGKGSSGLYQLTITGDTLVPIAFDAPFRQSKVCDICHYDFGLPGDKLVGRVYNRQSLADLDFQVIDRCTVEGREYRFEHFSRIVISGRLAKLINAEKFSGFVALSTKFFFQPILLEE